MFIDPNNNDSTIRLSFWGLLVQQPNGQYQCYGTRRLMDTKCFIEPGIYKLFVVDGMGQSHVQEPTITIFATRRMSVAAFVEEYQPAGIELL